MSSKLARWAVIIQSYPYTLKHVPAEQNGGPDSLSRLPSYEDEPNAAEELEEFLDRKILKVVSRESEKNVQVATITFENGNSGGLIEGETEREHEGFSTNDLADLDIGLNPPQTYTEDMFVIENQRLYRTHTPRNRRIAEAKGIIDWELSKGVIEDEGADTRFKEIATGREFRRTADTENSESSRTEAQKKCSQEQLNETILQTDIQSDKRIQRPTKVPNVQDQWKDVKKILGCQGKGYRVEMKDGTERIVKPEMVRPEIFKRHCLHDAL